MNKTLLLQTLHGFLCLLGTLAQIFDGLDAPFGCLGHPWCSNEVHLLLESQARAMSAGGFAYLLGGGCSRTFTAGLWLWRLRAWIVHLEKRSL